MRRTVAQHSAPASELPEVCTSLRSPGVRQFIKPTAACIFILSIHFCDWIGLITIRRFSKEEMQVEFCLFSRPSNMTDAACDQISRRVVASLSMVRLDELHGMAQYRSNVAAVADCALFMLLGLKTSKTPPAFPLTALCALLPG